MSNIADSKNTNPPAPDPQPNGTPPPVVRRSHRRRYLIIGLSALSLVILVLLAGLIYVCTGRRDKFIASEVLTALKEYGVRTEIGGFELSWKLRTATLRDVKFYNAKTGDLIGNVDRME